MKKVLIGVVIVTLPLIAFFQFQNWRRFHPAEAYEYAVSDAIDVHYHHAGEVQEYFTLAVEIGSFARQKWSNEGIDVRFPAEGDIAATNAAAHYNQMMSRVQYLEQKLVKSAELKKKGYDNASIVVIEEGLQPEKVKFEKHRAAISSLKIGDRSEHVFQLQKRLIALGYPHPLDGVFGTETQAALTSYQEAQSVFPSGEMNETCFELLFLK